jgi:anthranilate synthase component 1
VSRTITRAELGELASDHRLVPLTRTLFADAETPVGVYRKLAKGRTGTFLLESAEPGASFSRWSFVGVNAVATLSADGDDAVWSGDVPVGLPVHGDPLAVLGEAWRAIKAPNLDERLPGLPPLTGGFVGYLGYDVVRRIEKLPSKAVDDLGLPELTMLLVTDLAAVDHHECAVVLIANALLHPGMGEAALDAAYEDAVARLDAMERDLAAPSPATIATVESVPPKVAESRTPPGEHERTVDLCIEAIRAGEVFQIVPGQRFGVQTDADPLDVYRVLRTLNPSPYMYYLHLDAVDVVGSSPEALVTVHDSPRGFEATVHPIAGTRKRGATPERDAELITEMVNDPKERAEHVMLVDLARNDLGRVCEPGSVTVVEFGVVEKYQNVSHIVSTVTGRVRADLDAFDVFKSAFPHGTVTGAPKVRAMELIDEFEPVRRGIYSGAVGYMAPAGDIDMAICLRTAIMTGAPGSRMAYVQAGGGVVADSIPALEEKETRNKARAVLQAIATAETLKPVR